MKIKICCVSSIAEAKLALQYGATAIGLVSKMPSGPGVIPEELIAEIVQGVGPEADTFLLTSEINPLIIAAQVRQAGVTTVQLVDALEPSALIELRKMISDVALVQVVHVVDESSVEEAMVASKLTDALLLDSGNQSLAVKELGGTGRTHNWSISAEIVNRCPVPVYLAGGLRPSNIRDAIATVKPFGVDLCSGVRTDGKLDAKKLRKFMSEVHHSTL